MRKLEQKKLLTIITSIQLEEMVLNRLARHEIGGYTAVTARGAGTSGIQSGMLDLDTNVLIYIIISEPRLEQVLIEIDSMMNQGYRLKAIVTDISILPRKPA